MNILFLTLAKLQDLKSTMVYNDLMITFDKMGHNVYAVCPLEKKDQRDNFVESEGNIKLLHVNIGGNYFEVKSIEKGITLLKIEKSYIKGICKQFSGVKFDLILYTTPPITFNNVVACIKKRDDAVAYLMLKDIFPQNAVDLGMMSKKGIKGIMYHFFRKKEEKLYRISDYIGCMSPANVEYVKKHNPNISKEKIELSPNSIIIRDKSINEENRKQIRRKYKLPENKKIFVYGGNLGKPQGIDSLLECIKKAERINVLFLIIGKGTEENKIQEYINNNDPDNVIFMKSLPKEDYDMLVGACDVGMIFLDHCFTIPNFPSRILSYMQSKLPVLAATDLSSDIREVIEEGRFGWWCESNNPEDFCDCVERANNEDLKGIGQRSFEYLEKNYNVEQQVSEILKHVKNRRAEK